jgi:hypothetical protein
MKELVEKNKILSVVVGSQLYGTNTPTSDQDFSGIFIAPKRYYLGLDKIEEVDLSIVSKHENGKNDQDAVDMKYYELRKFMRLAMENNPNILEHLFVPADKIMYSNWLGRVLIDNATLFPYQGLKQKFLGYAFSQKHKMEIKTDNYLGLTQFNTWLEENLLNPREESAVEGKFFSNQLLAELRENKSLKGIVKFHEHHCLVGDINISLTDKLSKVFDKVSDRVSKVGSREELYTKYGYDTKFGMHLVRLMLEGKELLETGKLEYPLKERAMLMDIRTGKWKREDIIAYSEELEAEITDMKSDLPTKPRFDEIETLLMNMIVEHWGSK